LRRRTLSRDVANELAALLVLIPSTRRNEPISLDGMNLRKQ
jgi:hypothetical protein